MKYLHFLKWLHCRAYLKQTTLRNKTEDMKKEKKKKKILLLQNFSKKGHKDAQSGVRI